ncbi:MAG: hypothetical protein LC802_08340 [Acidobacteria bacterium]|nr:hypothetical protein [Acidobacteriota bacterium]
MAQERIGELPPRYSFALNPYNEWRCTKCPRCEQPTRLRKFALLIGVEDYGLMVLVKTCRFCPRCEFIIAHQDELEALLAAGFATHAPGVIGNDFYVLGTVERKTCRRGMRGLREGVRPALRTRRLVSRGQRYSIRRDEMPSVKLPVASDLFSSC